MIRITSSGCKWQILHNRRLAWKLYHVYLTMWTLSRGMNKIRTFLLIVIDFQIQCAELGVRKAFLYPCYLQSSVNQTFHTGAIIQSARLFLNSVAAPSWDENRPNIPICQAEEYSVCHISRVYYRVWRVLTPRVPTMHMPCGKKCSHFALRDLIEVEMEPESNTRQDTT